MGFWGWVGLIFFSIIGWNSIQWGIRTNDEAKAEEEVRVSRKKAEVATSEMERVRGELTQNLNKMWDQARAEYIDALKSGDKFLATAKGRDFYARNRRFSASRLQSQVIADEIRIKNEVAKGGAELVNALGLEELDFEGFRDRIEALAK